MSKIKFVVVNGKALGYIQPESPNVVAVLSSIIGSDYHHHHGPIELFGKSIRPATRQDFDTFRVSTDGYDTDPHYEMPIA